MRWNSKSIPFGTERWVTRFLFLPKKLLISGTDVYEWRWLEVAYILQFRTDIQWADLKWLQEI